MREIEFRAWDKNKQMWTNWKCYDNMFYFMDKNTGVWIRDDEFKRFVLLQYTGLKDSKGVEIYEGSIIRIRQDRYCDWRIYQVKYHGDRNYPAFDTEPNIDCDSNGLSYTLACCEVEVIGNVFENPELLEVSEC